MKENSETLQPYAESFGPQGSFGRQMVTLAQ